MAQAVTFRAFGAGTPSFDTASKRLGQRKRHNGIRSPLTFTRFDYWKYRTISDPIHSPTGTETPFPIIR